MTNIKARTRKPLDKVKIGLPFTGHLLRDISREKVEEHRKKHLTTKHLKISTEK